MAKRDRHNIVDNQADDNKQANAIKADPLDMFIGDILGTAVISATGTNTGMSHKRKNAFTFTQVDA